MQTKIISSYTNDFKTLTNQNLSVDKIDVHWNGAVELVNFFLEDHHGDTLIYISSLQTSILDYQKWKDLEFDFSKLDIKEGALHLTKYRNDTLNSLKILLNKLKREQNPSATLFTTKQIALANIDVHYKNEIDSTQNIHFKEVNLIADQAQFQYELFTIVIDTLYGKSLYPVAQSVALSGQFEYSPNRIALAQGKIESENQYVSGDFALTGFQNNFSTIVSQGIIDVQILESKFNLAEFFPNSRLFTNAETVDFKGHFQGALQRLKVTDLELIHPMASLRGELDIEALFPFSESQWKFTINQANINPQNPQLKSYLFQGGNSFFTPKSIEFSGEITADNSLIQANIVANNTWGQLHVNGQIPKTIISAPSSLVEATLNLKIDDFSPELKAVQGDLFTGGNIDVNTTLQNQKITSLAWAISDAYIRYKKTLLSQLTSNGRFENQQIGSTISINSPQLRVKSDLRYSFLTDLPRLTLAANIEQLDLNSFGIKIGSIRKDFKGILLADIEGKSLDDFNGDIKISGASLTNDVKEVLLNPITLSQKTNKGETQIEISNTDCIEGFASGRFKTSQLGVLLQNAIQHAYPFLAEVNPEENQQLTFNFKVYQKLLAALYPELNISENITLKGRIADDLKRSLVTLDAPFLQWQKAQMQNVHLQIDTNNPLYSTFLSVGKVAYQKYKGEEIHLISTQLKDTLFFRSEFNVAGSNSPYELNFYHTLEKNGNSNIGVKRSELLLGKAKWIVNPNNAPEQKISYSKNRKQWKVDQFLAISDAQSIQFNGYYTDPTLFKINAEVNEVILENLLPEVPTFKQRGVATLKTNIVRSVEENSLTVEAQIKDWIVNEEEMGDFTFSANGNTQVNTYVVQLDLLNSLNRGLTGKGVWQGRESPSVNIDLDFTSFETRFLSALGKENIQNIRGKLDGSVNLWGPISDLRHTGALQVSQGGFRIPYLNVEYQLEDTNVSLLNQEFKFRNVLLFEEDQGTQARLEGQFSHSNFRDWATDLSISSDRMLLLNTIQKPESLFFGTGFLNGAVHLIGPMKNLKIDVVGATDNNTSIKIPWAEDYGLTDTSFITYIDKNNRNSQKGGNDKLELKEIRGLEMGFELDVTPEAQIEIVIDQETGSYLSGRGAGNLFMEINTNGKFNMWGDFITYDGIYNFKNLGVIDKKFNVKSGGTIVWEGNPLEAQMNLEAVYDVPGGANPALLLDNPNFNRNIPTEVLIRLQGNLLKPDDPIFEIDFPNTSGTVASEINYRLADPQRSQLQAISLLSQGIFINEVSVSMQGITNNLYQKASDIVSNLIGEENDKLKVGIDYLQGDKSALLDIATEDRLGFTLSTQISDRILLNGKIGVPVGGVEQTLIVGNVQIDFILNDEGSLRAKVFNKENEFRYIGDELGYTQGVGLSYQVDFNTFKELIQKIMYQAKENTDEFLTLKSIAPPADLIQFVNKNE